MKQRLRLLGWLVALGGGPARDWPAGSGRAGEEEPPDVLSSCRLEQIPRSFHVHPFDLASRSVIAVEGRHMDDRRHARRRKLDRSRHPAVRVDQAARQHE